MLTSGLLKRTIEFYATTGGEVPTEEFLDALSDKVVQKIIAVIELAETERIVSTRFFKKLSGTELYEFRIRWESNIYRLLCFFDRDSKVVITHGFVKKAQKTPQREIQRAERFRRDYFSRKAR